MDIFILAGQSNMAGRGGVENHQWDGMVPSECLHSPGSIFRLNAHKEWEDAREPLHEEIDIGKVCGIGPGLVFAAELQRRQLEVSDRPPPERIGLVPCAIGGSSLSEWDREGPLYRGMVDRTVAALQGGATLRCMLWYQGESDTTSAELAEAYTSKMEALIHTVRADLNHPDLPIIQVGVWIGTLPSCQYLTRLREAQRQVHLPGVFMVDAMGLALQQDRLHLTTAAQVQLGKQLAEMYLTTVLPHLVS